VRAYQAVRQDRLWNGATAHSDAEFYGNNFDCIYFYTKSQTDYIFNTVYQPYDDAYVLSLAGLTPMVAAGTAEI